MPPTAKQESNELFTLENQLREELSRLFRDVNCWHLECRDYDWKRAYFDTYEFTDNGQLKLSFHVVGDITACENQLRNLTSEDLSHACKLVDRIRTLKNFGQLEDESWRTREEGD